MELSGMLDISLVVLYLGSIILNSIFKNWVAVMGWFCALLMLIRVYLLK